MWRSALLVAIGWFHVPFRGSFVTLAVSSALFMIVVLSLGFFISVVAKSQFAASQIALHHYVSSCISFVGVSIFD